MRDFSQNTEFSLILPHRDRVPQRERCWKSGPREEQADGSDRLHRDAHIVGAAADDLDLHFQRIRGKSVHIGGFLGDRVPDPLLPASAIIRRDAVRRAELRADADGVRERVLCVNQPTKIDAADGNESQNRQHDRRFECGRTSVTESPVFDPVLWQAGGVSLRVVTDKRAR